MKKPDEQKNINFDVIVRAIWGAILPHIAGEIKRKSSDISEKVLPERIRDLIASLVSTGAQIFEKEFKGVHFEILSDIFEQISIGVKAPVEEKKKAKPEEVRGKYEWPTLEQLEAIAKAKEIGVKRDLLLKFSSPNLHETIRSFSDKEIEDLIDVLIQVEKVRRETARIGLPLDLKSIWEIMKNIFIKLTSVIGRGLKETAKFIRENYSKLDRKAEELAREIERVRQSKKWRLI